MKGSFVAKKMETKLLDGEIAKQQAKNYVKLYPKLHFKTYMPMWCHFNGMLIVALCSIISMDIENSKLNHWIS
jgi:hypothetical protein